MSRFTCYKIFFVVIHNRYVLGGSRGRRGNESECVQESEGKILWENYVEKTGGGHRYARRRVQKPGESNDRDGTDNAAGQILMSPEGRLCFLQLGLWGAPACPPVSPDY